MYQLAEMEYEDECEEPFYTKGLGEYVSLDEAKKAMENIIISDEREFNIFSTENGENYWYDNKYKLILMC